jgi:hypothetical protein
MVWTKHSANRPLPYGSYGHIWPNVKDEAAATLRSACQYSNRPQQARLAIENIPRSSHAAVVSKWCQIGQLKLLTLTLIAAFYLQTASL